MDINLNLLAEKLANENSEWKLHFNKYENDNIHLVFHKKYNKDIIDLIKSEYIDTIICGIGIHIYNASDGLKKKEKIIISAACYDKDLDAYTTDQPIYKKKYLHPIDLELSDEFSVDLDHMNIINKSGQIVNNIFLEYAYKKHCLSTKVIRGIIIRYRLWLIKDLKYQALILLSWLFRIILFFVNGSIYKKSTIEIHFDELIGTTSVLEKINKDELIDFMSLKINPFTAFTYSLFHLLMAFIYTLLNVHNAIISKIINNTFLTLAYVIVSLTIWDRYIPKSFDKTIKYFAKKAYETQIKRIKV